MKKLSDVLVGVMADLEMKRAAQATTKRLVGGMVKSPRAEGSQLRKAVAVSRDRVKEAELSVR